MHREPYILIDRASNPQEGTLTVSGDEAHHLHKVMRAKEGDTFIAFDGIGHGWRAKVSAIDKESITARIVEPIAEKFSISKFDTTVAVGIIKGSRMDWAVEKAAELGAVRFIPTLSHFSVVTPKENRIKRWQTIALSAAKQSHRFRLMQVEHVQSVDSIIRNNAISINKLCALDVGSGTESLITVWSDCVTEKQVRHLLLFIGPEGGFSAEELALFKRHSIPSVTIGLYPLRTETAVAVVLGTLANFSL